MGSRLPCRTELCLLSSLKCRKHIYCLGEHDVAYQIKHPTCCQITSAAGHISHLPAPFSCSRQGSSKARTGKWEVSQSEDLSLLYMVRGWRWLDADSRIHWLFTFQDKLQGSSHVTSLPDSSSVRVWVELYGLGEEEAVRMVAGQKPREARQHGRWTDTPLGAFDVLAPRSFLCCFSVHWHTQSISMCSSETNIFLDEPKPNRKVTLLGGVNTNDVGVTSFVFSLRVCCLPWLVEFAGRWIIWQILNVLEFRFTASLILTYRTKVITVGSGTPGSRLLLA